MSKSGKAWTKMCADLNKKKYKKYKLYMYSSMFISTCEFFYMGMTLCRDVLSGWCVREGCEGCHGKRTFCHDVRGGHGFQTRPYSFFPEGNKRATMPLCISQPSV
jgi:hypothetical protein